MVQFTINQEMWIIFFFQSVCGLAWNVYGALQNNAEVLDTEKPGGATL